MNNSYINYIRNREPIKFIFNIFRNYKKSCEALQESKTCVKRNQSAPAVGQQDVSPETGLKDKRKSEDIQPSIVQSSVSRENLRLTWSNAKFGRSISCLNLNRKQPRLDTSIREKLEKFPVPKIVNKPTINVKPIYPWQNYNIDSLQLNKKFNKIKSVTNLSYEMLNMRKSILKKTGEPRQPVKSLPREVTFKKTASMLVYPKFKFNVMKQPSLNLSTGYKAEIPAKRKFIHSHGYPHQQHKRQHRPMYQNRKSKTEGNRNNLTADGANFSHFGNKKQRIY